MEMHAHPNDDWVWHLTVWRSPEGVLCGSFARTRDAWIAFNAAVLELEGEGFISDELTTVQYGGRWAQQLRRADGEVAVVRLDRSDLRPNRS